MIGWREKKRTKEEEEKKEYQDIFLDHKMFREKLSFHV
jgi:hypothetical protein